MIEKIGMPISPEKTLESLNIILPSAPKPAGQYQPARLVGNMLYLSGQGPRSEDGQFIAGTLGNDLTVQEGYLAGRNVGLQILAVAKDVLGDLSRIDSVVKLFGMVNASDSFVDHAKVVNGCSDLLVEVLGERGYHTRSVMGANSLPFSMILQVDAIFAIK
ncbi:RidA family protein [uncultured Vibrio sp.]|uniref:RidA family protein n=1 Tax=uncultured Vibrio sp. TaxID=114054 RepID=UPI0029C96669|nr:RidA family protein [uncultured Vibrio sp.]